MSAANSVGAQPSRSPIRVVFCDMDGTLFTPSPEHIITARTTEAIRQLQKGKVAFVVSTGRPYPDVFATIRMTGITPDYYITSNGARIHDRNFNVISEVDMDPRVALDMLQLPFNPASDGSYDVERCEPRSFIANVNCNGRWYTDKCLAEVRAVFHPSYDYEQVDPSAMNVETLTGTHSIWLRGEGHILAGLDRYIQTRYAGVVQSKFSLPFVLDIFPDSVSKGRAVEHVCKLLQVDLKDAAAFGDGMNDEPMMAICGHAYVMDNALQQLKDALPQAEVIGSNGEDGVAKKLEELFALSTSHS